jgi:predicted permease
MTDILIAVLNPMLLLFFCIALGFVLHKTHILPDSAGQVMAKLENWIFCPALAFSTTVTFCTSSTIATHAINISLATVALFVAIGISMILSRIFVRKKSPERGIYAYALAFANSGYMGDPLVQMLLGDSMLSYYKLYCLPITIGIYTWGINNLVPHEKQANPLKKILNPSTIAMVLGVVMGLSGLGEYIPTFLSSAINSLKACMGPVAMLLAGFTMASYDVGEILKDKKVYAATLLRLFLLPAIIVAVLFGAKELLNSCFAMNIGNGVLYLGFFATASALGLNTIVFPEAYGGNPKIGASMALISHTLCIVSMPIMYALMNLIFGPCQIL